jgi:hypothetical protein
LSLSDYSWFDSLAATAVSLQNTKSSQRDRNIKRVTAAMLQWQIHAPAPLQGETIARPMHRPAQHLDRNETRSALPARTWLPNNALAA